MKKLLILAALVFMANITVANAQNAVVGNYANDAGTLVVSQGQGENNFNVAIMDKSGKCNVQIQATTNTVTAEGKNGDVYHPNTILAVDSQTFPNFSLWPEDKTVKLADDALPFQNLDPACQAFKGNMVFTRQQ
ncbi:MAG: hypothetical protein HDQ91_06200 [Desulfovibrio sp.]|nr:hypothetical protein [Desulfovibrio sp.]